MLFRHMYHKISIYNSSLEVIVGYLLIHGQVSTMVHLKISKRILRDEKYDFVNETTVN